MGKPYSQDLRERVMAAVDSGTGAYPAAAVFRVSFLHLQGSRAATRDRPNYRTHGAGGAQAEAGGAR